MPAAPRSRRREEFISAAARLFAQRGYYAIGINDISAELGLTGPAIYRHFKNKQEILVAVMDRTIAGQLESIRDTTANISDPEVALERVATAHAEYALAEAENFRMWAIEARNLPDADRRRLRYLQHLYVEEWARVVSLVRADLGPDQVRVVCHGVLGLIQSVAEEPPRLPDEEVVAVLTQMVRDAVAGAPRSGRRSSPSRRPVGPASNGKQPARARPTKTKATKAAKAAKKL